MGNGSFGMRVARNNWRGNTQEGKRQTSGQNGLKMDRRSLKASFCVIKCTEGG
jgi:hypothetical protein